MDELKKDELGDFYGIEVHVKVCGGAVIGECLANAKVLSEKLQGAAVTFIHNDTAYTVEAGK